MKKLILALVLVGLSALEAVAQSPTYIVNTISIPVTVPAATQTNIPFATAPVIYIGKQDYVALSITGELSAAGTNIVYTFAPSVDGINWDTNGAAGNPNQRLIIVTVTNDLTPRTSITNLDVHGIGYLKLMSIYNKETSAVLTNAITFGTKVSTP